MNIVEPVPDSPADNSKHTVEVTTPEVPAHAAPRYLVGVGASAGGLEALQSFFQDFPRDIEAAFVVIQHLSPDHKSLMAELLSRHTSLTVRPATDDEAPMAGTVYLLPPKYNMAIREGRLRLLPVEMRHGLNLPVDRFLESLAEERGRHAVAVILSGAGSDGTRGIRAVKEAGGLVMVQDEQSAKFGGMPGSAIATGLADYILPARDLGRECAAYLRHAAPLRLDEVDEPHTGPQGTAIERILGVVKTRTGLDFSYYKRNTMVRRIERRFSMAQVNDYEEYLQFVQGQPREAEQLSKDLLINVTRFFRDPDVFTFLGDRVIPEIVSRIPERGTLRVWSVGCASGEEAYSVAMLIEEAIRARSRAIEYKVFATDLHRESIDFAGNGMYPASIAADVPPNLVERYMIRQGDTVQIRREVRERVVFARQNLLKDPPFTKIDLVICRNLMIYLQPAAQRKALALFYFGLNPHGVLLLGHSESCGEFASAFEPVDAALRIFARKDGIRLALHDTLTLPSVLGSTPSGPRDLRASVERTHTQAWDAVRDQLIEQHVSPGVMVNERNEVLHSFGRPVPFLRLPLGRVSTALAKLLPAQLAAAVVTACHRARSDNVTVTYEGLEFEDLGVTGHVDLTVYPADAGAVYPHALIVMFGVPHTPAPDMERPAPEAGAEDPDHVAGSSATAVEVTMLRQRVADLERDVADTRVSLQTALEERETSNEELQASNEELLSSNEELQSTNEELESVNEELYTVNSEYQGKIQELLQLNDDMDNFLQSTDIGVLFLDSESRIRKFTPAMSRAISLLPTDLGRPLKDLGHAMVGQILKALSVANTEPERVVEQPVEGPDDRHYLLQVRPFRRHLATNQGTVVTLLDVTGAATPPH